MLRRSFLLTAATVLLPLRRAFADAPSLAGTFKYAGTAAEEAARKAAA